MYFDDFFIYLTFNFTFLLKFDRKILCMRSFDFSNGFQKLNMKIPNGFKAVYTMFLNVINVKHRCLKKKS